MSLNEQLEKMREVSWGSWPAENRQRMYRARDELARSGIFERALKKGQTAPDFTLPAADGTRVTLSDLLKTGPVVLTFYRGHW
jgi:hypothetical protein